MTAIADAKIGRWMKKLTISNRIRRKLGRSDAGNGCRRLRDSAPTVASGRIEGAPITLAYPGIERSGVDLGGIPAHDRVAQAPTLPARRADGRQPHAASAISTASPSTLTRSARIRARVSGSAIHSPGVGSIVNSATALLENSHTRRRFSDRRKIASCRCDP